MDYYLPGNKAGGAPRSVANLVERLGDRFRFRIVTRDRDLGDTAPYPGIQAGRWLQVGRAEVLYLAPEQLDGRGIARVLRRTTADVLYLNSFFSVPFSVLPLLLRRAGLVARGPVVLAPRGEMSDGSLSIRPRRKRAYQTFASAAGLLSGVTWQASSAWEAADIRARFPRLPGGADAIRVACDVPMRPEAGATGRMRRKEAGELRLLFVSRIHRIKNLAGVLEMLKEVRGQVELEVYGPCEDREYFEECVRAARGLPGGMTMRYHGTLPHGEVAGVMREHDLFILPSQGENFGHVIFEALAAGCPVLVSDRTPWRGLEARGAGWDVALENTTGFSDAIQSVVDMDDRRHAQMRAAASALAEAHAAHGGAIEQNAALFQAAARPVR